MQSVIYICSLVILDFFFFHKTMKTSDEDANINHCCGLKFHANDLIEKSKMHAIWLTCD